MLAKTEIKINEQKNFFKPRLLTLGGLISGLGFLCYPDVLASFCAPADTAHMLYNEDSGN